MSVRQSDLKYLRNTYGWIAKVKEVFSKGYLKLCAFAKFLSLTITLFLIPVLIGFIVYYVFLHFNPVKVVVFCIVLWVMIDSNSKL